MRLHAFLLAAVCATAAGQPTARSRVALPLEVWALVFSFLPRGQREAMLLELRHVSPVRGTLLALAHGDPAELYGRMCRQFNGHDLAPMVRALGPRSKAALAAGAILSGDKDAGLRWFAIPPETCIVQLFAPDACIGVLDERQRGALMDLCVAAVRSNAPFGLADTLAGRPKALVSRLLIDAIEGDTGIAAELWPFCTRAMLIASFQPRSTTI